MKRSLGMTGVVFSLSLLFVEATACAQNTPAVPRGAAQRTDRSQAGKLDNKTMGASIRVSQLMGMAIQNGQGKDVAKVNDIVLDANSGEVKYLAVTYGGFLGLGDKLFAVPFEAFKVKQDADNVDKHLLHLNVTEKQLEGASGFDQDSWPNFADKNFTQDLDKRYGVDRTRHRRNRNRDAEVDVDIGQKDGGIDVNVKPNTDRP